MLEQVIVAFILGTIGLIFSFDAVCYVVGRKTISGQVTKWINNSYTNLIIFVCIILVICVHFIFG